MPITFFQNCSASEEKEKTLLPSLKVLPIVFNFEILIRSERKRKTDCVKFYKLWISGGEKEKA